MSPSYANTPLTFSSLVMLLFILIQVCFSNEKAHLFLDEVTEEFSDKTETDPAPVNANALDLWRDMARAHVGALRSQLSVTSKPGNAILERHARSMSNDICAARSNAFLVRCVVGDPEKADGSHYNGVYLGDCAETALAELPESMQREACRLAFAEAGYLRNNSRSA